MDEAGIKSENVINRQGKLSMSSLSASVNNGFYYQHTFDFEINNETMNYRY